MPTTLCSSSAGLQLILLAVMMTRLFLDDVSAQPMVDDDAAQCQSRTLEELVHEVRAGIKTSRQCHTCASSDQLTESVQAIRRDLTAVKNLLVSRQQQQPHEFTAFDSASTLCECKFIQVICFPVLFPYPYCVSPLI